MTGVANARHPNLQQLWIVGPVRLMARGAVFENRRMLPQERSTSFGMTTEAILCGGCLNQLFRIRTAVWVVAAGAGDFAFAIRHM